MTAANSNEDQFAILRRTMVEQVALHAGHVGEKTGRAMIADPVMEAIGRVPRHAFVPVEMTLYAYLDSPLPIGCGKTISQPFIVALMTDLLEIGAEHRVLEIGTGLGYQAALLAELAAEVYTVELIEELAESGRRRLGEQGYGNVQFRIGDGSLGCRHRSGTGRYRSPARPTGGGRSRPAPRSVRRCRPRPQAPPRAPPGSRARCRFRARGAPRRFQAGRSSAPR